MTSGYLLLKSMTDSEECKPPIADDLAGSNAESGEPIPVSRQQEDQNFDGLAGGSSLNEPNQLLEQSRHCYRLPAQIESEVQNAIAQMKPNERDDIARKFLKGLKQQGFCDRELEKQLSCSPHQASGMTTDSVTKLASFTYHNYPDIFQDVLTEQPTIVKFFSNSLMGVIFNAIAAKWLGNHRHF